MKNENLNLQKFVVSVVIVGIVLILGIYINSTLGTQLENKLVSGSVINETGYINNTGYTVAKSTEWDFANFAIVHAYNRSSGSEISSGNFTYTQAGLIKNKTAVNWNNASFIYTYTYTNNSAASLASLQVVDALSTGTSWISILVVVGFAVVILHMLVNRVNEVPKEPFY